MRKIKVLAVAAIALISMAGAKAQVTESTQEDQSQKQFKNVGISLNMGCSFWENNQFKQSLQDNGITLDIPKASAFMSLKINFLDVFGYGLISVEMGMEGTNRKGNNHYMGLRAVNGVVEVLYPVVNQRKIRVFPSFGLEYSYAMFEYYSLDSTPISFQDLSVIKDGSVSLHHDYSFSALFGVYFNYFFKENQGVSIFAKYRLPTDKGNARWKVAHTDRSVTDLDRYIPNYFILGVRYVFTF